MGLMTDLAGMRGNSSPPSSESSGSSKVSLADTLKKIRKRGRATSDSDGDSSGPDLGYTVPSYKRGGKVRQTGLAMMHKGEYVIPAKRRGRQGRGKNRVSKVR